MNKKIKEMADKLAKSFEEKENLKELKNVVEEIGREGVEEVIKALPEASQILFKNALAKAMSLDEAAKEKHGAKIKQVESEDARDEDEEAAKKRREADKGENLKTKGGDTVQHQGDSSELPGQIIKAEEVDKDEKKEKKMADKMADAVDEMAEGEAEEAVKEHEDEMHKKEVKKGAMKELAFEELEKGELLHKMIEKLRKRGMDHDKVMDALGKKGYDVEMAKGKWAEMEENHQQEQAEKEKTEKKMAKSESVVTEELPEITQKSIENASLKAAETQGAPEKPSSLEKSVNWASENERLEVSAKRGHNTHYDVDAYLVQKAMDKVQGEPLKKSEETPKEFDANNVNDIIEKGFDRSMDDVKQAVGHVRKAQGGDYNTSSFSDEDLAKSMGMTIDEMNEVLGVPGKKPQAQ